MVRTESIRKRLRLLDEYRATLYQLQGCTLDEFVSDPKNFGSAERFMQIAIEALIDLGNHVIAEQGLGMVDAYSDIPTILAEHGYITPELSATWIKMIGFRNLLVHDYADIDRAKVYDVLQNRLGDIEALQKVFAQFL